MPVTEPRAQRGFPFPAPRRPFPARAAAAPAALLMAALSLLPAGPMGCARKAAPPADESALVDRHLDDAADVITRDLAAMNGSAQAYDGIPASASLLRSSGTLLWDGPIEGALEKACAAVGFRLVVLGEAPEVPVMVHVRMTDRPWLSIIRAIGRQTGTGQRVRLLEAARVVELAYLDDGSAGAR